MTLYTYFVILYHAPDMENCLKQHDFFLSRITLLIRWGNIESPFRLGFLNLELRYQICQTIICNYIELRGQKKTATSRIVQTIWNCKAVHTLDLLLLILKCPFNKIKILYWAVKALEKSFRLICNTIQYPP